MDKNDIRKLWNYIVRWHLIREAGFNFDRLARIDVRLSIGDRNPRRAELGASMTAEVDYAGTTFVGHGEIDGWNEREIKTADVLAAVQRAAEAVEVAINAHFFDGAVAEDGSDWRNVLPEQH